MSQESINIPLPSAGASSDLSRAQMFRLFDIIPDAVVIADGSGAIVHANVQAERLFGYGIAEMAGMRIEGLIPERMKKAHETQRTAYQRDPKLRPMGRGLQLFGKRKDGTELAVDVMISPTIVNGERYVIATVRDVTVLREMEALLKERESAYRMLFDANPEPMFVVDMESFKFLAANRKALSDYGYSEREFLAMSVKDILPKDMTGGFDGEMERFRRLSGTRFEHRHVKKDGTVIDVEITPQEILFAGRPAHLTLARDLTMQKRAERIMRESELQVRTVLQGAAVILWAMDKDGMITLSDGKKLDVLGLKPGEIVGRSVFEVYSDPALHKILRRALAGEDFYHTISTGTHVLETHHSPSYNERGEFEGSVCVTSDITERTRAEEARRESEKRYHQLFDRMMDGVYRSTHDGHFVDVNPAMVRMFGFESREEMLKVEIKKDLYFAEEDRESLFLDSGEEKIEVFRMRRNDGGEIWVEDHGQYVHNERGEVIYHEGILRDVTDRVHAEHRVARMTRLKEQLLGAVDTKDKLRFITEGAVKIFDASCACVWVIRDGDLCEKGCPHAMTTEGPNVCRNRSACLHLVSTSGLHAPGTMVRRIPLGISKIGQVAQGEHSKIVLNGPDLGARIADGIVVVPDGVRGFAAIRLNSDEGKAVGVLAMLSAHEILADDQKSLDDLAATAAQVVAAGATLEALHRSEAKYRTLFEESKDVLFITSPDGRTIDINPAGVELFGFSSEEELLRHDIRGKKYWDPAQRKLYQALLERQGYVQDYEIELKTRDGRELVVQETSTAERDERGNVLAYRGMLRDVTERKRAERERQLLEDRLMQSQKLESLGTLAGGVAHDFNNILAIILGHTSMLQSKPQTPEVLAHSLKTINNVVQRGANLVKQILTFARKSDVVYGSLDLNAVIVEMERLLAETLPKTITFVSHLDTSIPMLRADPTQIHQTLLNICLNARDAMPNGGVMTFETTCIPVHTIREKFRDAEAKHYVHLSIADTGTGMDEQTRRRIFEPFFTTKEKGKGTGLGLAVAYGVVAGHRGFIDAESSEGNGTTFHMYFPVSEAVPEAEPAKERIAAAGEANGGSELILVVEDETMLADMLQAALEAQGYRVLTAPDGERAVEMYRQHGEEIDLVLTDLGLPKMNGEAVFRELKKINPGVGVILISGYIEPEVRAAFVEMGAKDIVQKPYLPKDILANVRQALDGKD